MKIQLDRVSMDMLLKKGIYPNRTRQYILPILTEYGETFRSKINSVVKVACGIGDIIVENSGLNYEKHLFILIDTSVANKHFINFLNYIRVQSYYEDDYVYGDIQKSNFHMIVLKVPERFYTSLETFKKGKYSKMYEVKDLEKFFKNHPDTKKVLVRDHNYKIEFIGKVNKEFNSNIDNFDNEDYELDLPPNKEEETF